MIDFLRNLWRSIWNPLGRREWVYFFLADVPLEVGMILRRKYIVSLFGQAGSDIQIHPGARFRNPQLIKCGNKVEFGPDAFVQAGGGVTIGDYSMVGPGARVWSQNHKYQDPSRPILVQGAVYDEVTIGEDCWIGAGAFIMPGVNLPNGCVVSALSVVGKKKYKPGSILIGNPARLIGNRYQPKPDNEGTDKTSLV